MVISQNSLQERDVSSCSNWITVDIWLCMPQLTSLNDSHIHACVDVNVPYAYGTDAISFLESHNWVDGHKVLENYISKRSGPTEHRTMGSAIYRCCHAS